MNSPEPQGASLERVWRNVTKNWFSWGLAALLLLSVYSLHSFSQEHSRAVEVWEDRAASIATDRDLLRHLAHYFRAQEFSHPRLQGQSIRGGWASKPVHEPTLLVYLSSRCVWGPSNYEFLRELWSDGVSVLGMAWGEELHEVRDHVAEHDLPFPVLLDPDGSIPKGLPRFGTPFLVAMDQGRVVGMLAGALAEDARERLRAALVP